MNNIGAAEVRFFTKFVLLKFQFLWCLSCLFWWVF